MAKDILTDNQICELNQTIQNGDEKYLCFTTFDLQWTICVTDGVNVWRLSVDEDDFQTHKELTNIDKDDAFCSKIRNGFVAGDISVAKVGTKMKLSIGKGTSSIAFDLYEAKAADKKTDMKNVLFRLAEKAINLEQKLSVANQKIDKLQLEKSANKGTNPIFDTGSKRGAAASSKAKPKKAGMSVVNPNSKKRKAATGVVFD
ncbi:hypothetical protein LOTGIDRAFT_234912 [Lottia gigantea]|uniref:Uncharacterized protein n=1 Tax=Lottia gigantea TaxID=225164 RepID=V4BFG4_LOTGI|nr:hypothetical protein LOTGIDRAFT_234912 [Lottia gigantea]ESO87659.1 hypothetical protein LOTGIDRAFT_234912 [Lottia gigantea]